jgi:hypothetical protein
MSGFDIGIDDSKKQRNWLFDNREFLQISYPDSLKWGILYFITGSTLYNHVFEDFSYYKSISIELKIDSLNNPFFISLEDVHSERRSNAVIKYLSEDWQTINLSLKNFSDVNFKELRVPLKFVFLDRKANSIQLRKVIYNSYDVDDTLLYDTQIMNDSNLKPEFLLDCNTSDTLTNWIKEQEGYWIIQFPPKQKWSTVFISTSLPRNYSKYTDLSIEVKGKYGGETFGIGINDKIGEDPSSISSIKWIATNEWEKLSIPLSQFKDVDLKNIYIPLQLVSYLPNSQTIYFRNVTYY